MLAVLFDRRPAWLPVAAVGALPFRIPIASGGSTANLLVPLYLVVAAGALAYAVPRLRGRRARRGRPRAGRAGVGARRARWRSTRQSTYSTTSTTRWSTSSSSTCPSRCCSRSCAASRGRRAWRACASACSSCWRWRSSGIGFVEYATRHLLLNPKVIASNQFEAYFRVNSLFFDPNIYGRFLAHRDARCSSAWLLWARRPREVVAGALLLAVLWGGLVLTFSQSSFAALLVGLAVLGALRWSVRWALIAVRRRRCVVAVAFVALAPGRSGSTSATRSRPTRPPAGATTSSRAALNLFADPPLVGQGSGSFAREFRRAEHVSAERAASASHTIPVTVAAEQGVLGLLVYLALLAAALARLFRGARGGCPCAPPWRRRSWRCWCTRCCTPRSSRTR